MRGFDHASEAVLHYVWQSKVNSTDHSLQLTFRFTLQVKIGGSAPVLANHKNRIFPLKRAFLGESQ